MTDYKAKQEVWKGFENLYGLHNPFNPIYAELVDTILELRSRIETLEANSSLPFTNPSHSAKSELSLVERVTKVIAPYTRDYRLIKFQPEARAAILEIATWLEEEFGPQIDWITTELRQETEQ